MRLRLLAVGAVVAAVCAGPESGEGQVPGRDGRESRVGELRGSMDERDPDAVQTPAEQERIQDFDTRRREENPDASFIPTDVVGSVEGQVGDGGSGEMWDRLGERLSPGGESEQRVETPVERLPARAMQGLREFLGREYRMVARTRRVAADEEEVRPGPGDGASERSEARAPIALGAGEMVYATLETAVDSRFSLPVIVRVRGGVLDGAVLSGGFDVRGDVVGLRFRDLMLGDRVQSVDAWAVGPECECAALEGEVDHHWFERVILPAAGAFASGYLRAGAQADRTVTIEGTTVVEERSRPGGRELAWQGVAGAVDVVTDVLGENRPAGPTVRLPRGAEMLVVFARPVRGWSAAGRRR